MKIRIVLIALTCFAQISFAQTKGQHENKSALHFKQNFIQGQLQKKKDSLDRLRMTEYEKYVIDSLREKGINVSNLHFTVQTMGSTEETKSRTSAMRTTSGSGFNLGFEDGFTNWTRTLYYDLRKVMPGAAGLTPTTTNVLPPNPAMPDNNPPDIIYPEGIASKWDGDPVNINPQALVNQPLRHVIHPTSAAVDPYGGFPIVPSFAQQKVARIGNGTVGFGGDHSSNNGKFTYEQEEMSHTFVVPASTPYLLLNYAVVLNDPLNAHITPFDRTYFKITVDIISANGTPTPINCATYDVYAQPANYNIPGFIRSDVLPPYSSPSSPKSVLYKPWTSTIVNLLPNVGQTVKVTFRTGDCLSGGHWAYAYVDAGLTSNGIITASNGVERNTFCIGESIDLSSLLTGRYEGEAYVWKVDGAFLSNQRAPRTSFNQIGNRTITLEVSDASSNGSCIPISKMITITQAPSAAFSMSDPTPVPGQSITFTPNSTLSGDQVLYVWGDGTSTTSGGNQPRSKVYVNPGTYTVQVTVTRNGCSDTRSITFSVQDLCVTTLPSVGAADGTFKMDKLTGAIVFQRTSCPNEVVMPCVTGSATAGPKTIKATANIFSETWPHVASYPDNSGVPIPEHSNQFETGERGKWRIKSTYTYNTSLAAEDKNFRSGYFSLEGFNWKQADVNHPARWLLGSEITAYSPHGDALAERNLLNIESTVKFGYQNAVPYLTAKNAGLNSVLFESFEMSYANNTKLEDKMVVPPVGSRSNNRQASQYAHSGYHSWGLPSGGNFRLNSFRLTANELTKGLQVKVWLRLGNQSSFSLLQNNASSSNPLFVVWVDGSLVPVPFKIVARTGEWILCEASITNFGSLVADQSFSLTIDYTVSEPVWIDDIRVQPMGAEMNCYVYDPDNLRLMAVFDDQHFGLIYQYNPEGKLIRKMIETERGIKTIQETQYNTVLKNQ